MKRQISKPWNSEQLVQLSQALGGGYVPGLQGSEAASDDRWTTQRHITASTMLGQAYL
ncbi:hypothetical protein [Leptolyngbya sp. KIOST-1]|uniref:hypothetical protein n=1 Tax=Leptolyngbya sp. KIOST-1 TaxID=1229172 RepID=UPI000A974568|nr:hypothetical protein [Leptolyngbya sp. KIOST-1]